MLLITRALISILFSSSNYLFLISYSFLYIRLEKKLNLLIAEVRAEKREGSIIST